MVLSGSTGSSSCTDGVESAEVLYWNQRWRTGDSYFRVRILYEDRSWIVKFILKQRAEERYDKRNRLSVNEEIATLQQNICLVQWFQRKESRSCCMGVVEKQNVEYSNEVRIDGQEGCCPGEF